ncbi:hypothetical protein SK571_28775 [Lentzea sp. BCCO 10_0798]|uniref:GLTT repeat-containing protein n=1 Tax=Lentzea kristufekii TaxID=3095430 RepID=A0ABU4TYJ1_9PSEU|nr:hypothetical protein [Lentzea sp. BCCO 10_0798]MDX8053388.1 hypothetical protein [Lentzea sp. BCCO 10_0798]
MSRTGLFRAAALLAASAAPLLAGSASAAELPQLNTGVPEVGADKLVSGATQLANPLDAASAVQLPHVGAPVASDLPVPALPAVAQERSVPHPIAAEVGEVAGLPDPRDLPGTANIGNLPSPSLSDLPTNNVVPNPTVLSGTLPTING